MVSLVSLFLVMGVSSLGWVDERDGRGTGVGVEVSRENLGSGVAFGVERV